jgi:hypothetical protein
MTHEQFQQKVQAIPDKELIEIASLAISKLCKTGAKSFTMTVPPQLHDTDIILSEIVQRFEKTNNFSLNNYGKIEFKDLQKVSFIHDKIINVIHITDSIHEDIIEFMLKPFEDILKHHGVNLSETDF